MASKRIYQLAKEFECDEKKIIDFLTKQGIKVANRLSAVNDETYNFLKIKLFAPPPPESEPKLEEPPQVAPPAEPSKETPFQEGDNKKKKKKKKKNPQLEEQVEDFDGLLQDMPINKESNLSEATQAVYGAAITAGNDFIKDYIPTNNRIKNLKSHLSRSLDIWGLVQDIKISEPDSAPILYWEAVNKLTTKAYKLMQEFGIKNRELLGEMRESVKSVGAKYEPQNIFTEEENQKFETQQKALFVKFGHGMGKVNDNLFELKMYAENKKAYCEHMSFVEYLTNSESKLELKIPMPFYALAETILYSIRSVPRHVDFYTRYKQHITRAIENFFEWINGYKKLKEHGADAAKLKKYLELEEKFFDLVDFMSFDNLLKVSRKEMVPFNSVLNLLNDYRDNMDEPDAERNFKYKVRGIASITYKPKEFVFLYQFADLEPQKDYRPPEDNT